MATGDTIRRHRKAKGLTQAQLAEPWGLPRAQSAHYESGIRAVKPELLEKIAKDRSASPRRAQGLRRRDVSRPMALLLQLEEGYGLVPTRTASA